MHKERKLAGDDGDDDEDDDASDDSEDGDRVISLQDYINQLEAFWFDVRPPSSRTFRIGLRTSMTSIFPVL